MIKIPLAVRILGLVFVNLFLLGLAAVAFFHFQMRVGLDSIFAGRASERLQAVSRLLEDELRLLPPREWSNVLERFDSAYGIQFTIFSDLNEQVAGKPVILPREAREKFLRPRPSGPRRPPFDISVPEHGRPKPPREPFRGPGPRPDLIHAESRYWILMPLRLNEDAGPGRLVLIAISDDLSAGGLIFDARPLIAAGIGVMLFSVLFWLPFFRGITHAISRIKNATRSIADGNFEARAPENRRDELGALGSSINQMAVRLNGFIQGQKRFLGDTSHELVSPLARMEMAVAILEQKANEGSRSHLQDLHDEVRLMSGLVNELLSFSKASLGVIPINLKTLALSEIIDETLQREGVKNAVVIIPAGCNVLGDHELLHRAFGNVIRNALLHAGNASPIEIVSSQMNGLVSVGVKDTGPGVPEEALEQIFDPFFRLDQSRDRTTGGTGLGLAITKTCVESCGGSVACRNLQPHGFEMMISLRSGS